MAKPRISPLFIWIVSALGLVATLSLTNAQPIAQSPGASNASPADQLTRGVVFTTDELAVAEALARGQSQTAYSLLLSLIGETAKRSTDPNPEGRRTSESAGDQGIARDRMAALCELLWTEIDRNGWHKQAAKDLAALEPDAEIVRLIGECARANGDLVLLSWAEQELGFISGWMVCGPFDNDRGAGFTRGYFSDGVPGDPGVRDDGVEGTPEVVGLPRLSETYVGRGGHETGWRPVPVAPRMGHVDLDAMMRPSDHVCAYAFTLVEAAEAGPALLGVASNDGLRVWLNGRELPCASRNAEGHVSLTYGTSAHRDCTFDQQTWTVPLAAGMNVLMVKVMDEEGAWGFRARLKGLRGTRVTLMAPSERATWESRVPSSVAVADGDAGSPEHGAAVLGDARQRYWAGVAEMFRGRTERKNRVAHHLLASVRRELMESEPGRELVHVTHMLAAASASTAETMAGAEENERRDLLLAVLEADPRHVPALLEMAAHYTSHLQIPAKAEEYARRALEVAPGNADAVMLIARAAAQRGLMAEYQRQCRILAEAGHGSPMVHRYMAFMAERTDDHALAVTEYGKAFGMDARDTHSRGRVLEEMLRQGDVGAYHRISRESEALHPFDLDLLEQRAEVMGDRGQETEALTLLRRALEVSPHDDQLLLAAGRMAQRLAFTVQRRAEVSDITMVDGKPHAEVAGSYRMQAMAWFRLAVTRNPTRSDIRRHAEFLSDEVPAHESEFVQDISGRIRESFGKDYAKDAEAHWLWMDTITKVNADGSSMRHVHAAIKVTNDRGRDALRDMQLWANGEVRVLDAKLHRADGSTVNCERKGNGLASPPLEVGDVLEARWRTADTEKTFFGDYFGDVAVLSPNPPGVFLQCVQGSQFLAADKVRVTWLLASGREFHFHAANGAPQPEESVFEGSRVVRYTAKQVARVEREPVMLPEEQWRPTVYVSTFRDWDAFGTWYWNLIERQVRSTPGMAAKVAELTAGIQGEGPEAEIAKAKAIYHWVVTAIRYNANWEFGVHGYKPYEAGAIFDRCIGDCKDKAILIVAMLRHAGITAWPVIINAETIRGREDVTLAMPNHFNHAIAVIEFSDGSRRFVDGTATYVSWDEGLPEMDAGARVLVVKPGASGLADIPPADPEKNRDQWEFVMQVRADGSAGITAANAPSGNAASRWRQLLEAEGQRISTMNRVMGGVMRGATVSTVEADGVSDLNRPVKFGLTAEVARAGVQQGGKLTFAVPFSVLSGASWTQTAWGFSATRTTDMGLYEGLGERVSTVVMPPKGMVFAGLPSAVTVENPHIRFEQQVERVAEGPLAGGVRITRSWGITAKVVAASDYPAFREALVKIDQANAQKVELVGE